MQFSSFYDIYFYLNQRRIVICSVVFFISQAFFLYNKPKDILLAD